MSAPTTTLNYKLVIFDFDGTLADSLPWFVHAINEVAAKHGFKKITTVDYNLLRGADVGQVLAHLGISRWKIPVIAKELRAMMTAEIHKIELFKGIDGALRELADNGVVLGIVSSNARANIEKVLGPELMSLMPYAECGVSIFGKSGKLRKILKTAGTPKSQAIYVGDEIRDAQAAQKLQMAFGAVSWGYSQISALRSFSPAVCFTRIEDIAEKLL